MTPSLAESYTESADKMVYEFKLRPGIKFHNGEPVTAEDVKFTFERYKGAAAKLLKEKVKAVEVVDAQRVRFHLHAPWPGWHTDVGPRVKKASLGKIPPFYYAGPFADMRLQGK